MVRLKGITVGIALRMCVHMCAQLCRLCKPMGCSLQGSSVYGVFQARILEQVATSYFRGL